MEDQEGTDSTIKELIDANRKLTLHNKQLRKQLDLVREQAGLRTVTVVAKVLHWLDKDCTHPTSTSKESSLENAPRQKSSKVSRNNSAELPRSHPKLQELNVPQPEEPEVEMPEVEYQQTSSLSQQQQLASQSQGSTADDVSEVVSSSSARKAPTRRQPSARWAPSSMMNQHAAVPEISEHGLSDSTISTEEDETNELVPVQSIQSGFTWQKPEPPESEDDGEDQDIGNPMYTSTPVAEKAPVESNIVPANWLTSAVGGMERLRRMSMGGGGQSTAKPIRRMSMAASPVTDTAKPIPRRMSMASAPGPADASRRKLSMAAPVSRPVVPDASSNESTKQVKSNIQGPSVAALNQTPLATGSSNHFSRRQSMVTTSPAANKATTPDKVQKTTRRMSMSAAPSSTAKETLSTTKNIPRRMSMSAGASSKSKDIPRRMSMSAAPASNDIPRNPGPAIITSSPAKETPRRMSMAATASSKPQNNSINTSQLSSIPKETRRRMSMSAAPSSGTTSSAQQRAAELAQSEQRVRQQAPQTLIPDSARRMSAAPQATPAKTRDLSAYSNESNNANPHPDNAEDSYVSVSTAGPTSTSAMNTDQELSQWSQETIVENPPSVESIRPTKRLIGEVAFQLDRRFLNYVFCDSHDKKQKKRFYGFILKNIPDRIMRESCDDSGQLDPARQHLLHFRYSYLLRSLAPLGYNVDRHSEISAEMVNKYGLLPVDKGKSKRLYPQDKDLLMKVIAPLAPSHEQADIRIMVDCLALLASDDGSSMMHVQ